MKIFRFTLFTLVLVLVGLTPSHATILTKAEAEASVSKQKTELKKAFKAEKKMAKLERFLQKAGIDFKDPVEKWMWFWIFGWGAGLLLSLLIWTALPVGLWWLSSVAWLFGTVSLVIWLVKKFGN